MKIFNLHKRNYLNTVSAPCKITFPQREICNIFKLHCLQLYLLYFATSIPTVILMTSLSHESLLGSPTSKRLSMTSKKLYRKWPRLAQRVQTQAWKKV